MAHPAVPIVYKACARLQEAEFRLWQDVSARSMWQFLRKS